MPVRFLTDAQREQLSGFPAELDAEALDRFFTFSDADLAEISRRHGDGNRLGWALQLSGLRLLGFCPADVTTAPAGAVTFVARQLGVNPGVLEGYGARAQTRIGPRQPGEGVPGVPLGHSHRPRPGPGLAGARSPGAGPSDRALPPRRRTHDPVSGREEDRNENQR